ncbi:hypothetical protein NEPAR06_2260 [Nematocida parisii]|uniref:Uncharacterized protein n=1 Tax=Nematocida parisii (strain ERTm3) TaxID=935791 RepID=I3EF55_NEMP3|nr:uncharacterized protein NEPG_02030 [Nematocida parisii ERTm1]EIJ87852.1 hypothetical protein NEQG_01924 [Nematocida parisii ERTm3]KAI5129245.1 hypothetical protein NEPAR03_1606 [Nematocida parisii]EIJ93074.1 hypothetical protein NEPG_02030 [Nematocida parisii ERTm1]KAI5129423.1 hypothetical protein NEPAR08_1573 [Nematocida parisii]KAI5141978.1 hypothetical protein NEPAR04_1334 [Nematocida parisii]|eukprot:XP_013059857.1 hypothetical protein NEPG_02030 [Nematocida parisii ERTm1]
MGILFSKKSVRQAILELEQQIEEKEKTIKYLKKRKESASDIFFKSITAISIGAISILWVCKETISYLYILRIIALFIILCIVITLLYYGNKRLCNYRLNKNIMVMEVLKEKQRKNIENLKKETKYDETHGIIKRYVKHVTPKEEEEALDRPDETVVDKLVRLI